MILKLTQILQSINARVVAESVKIELLGKGEMILTVTSREMVNG